MGSYKTREITRAGIKVILEIPEPSYEDGQAKQEIKKMLNIFLRERMQTYFSEGGGA